MRQWLKFVWLVCCLMMILPTTVGAEQADGLWFTGTDGAQKIRLYFFHTDGCPHCRAAKPVLQAMTATRPWLLLEQLEVGREDNERLFFMLAREFNSAPEAVPSFFLCQKMVVGFDNEQGTGQQLADIADRCYAALQQPNKDQKPAKTDSKQADNQIRLPFVGSFDAQSLSLPVLTIVLGGLDAFNPCAFFVLLFLLSLMVHAKNRKRMALVGGLFVLISGVMYFIFMAAWLNLFLVLHNVGWITMAAGAVAVLIGALAIKDYFLLHQGPSLSIPAAAKPVLFRRMGALSAESSIPMLVLGTVLLAVSANMYELLCTSGFPLVYTRILTQNHLSPAAQYAYLAAYNLVYILPLLVIVALFVKSLGARKLSEHEGRMLKLLSGLMMLGLGGLLILAPALLSNLLVAIGLLLTALLAAFTISRILPS